MSATLATRLRALVRSAGHLPRSFVRAADRQLPGRAAVLAYHRVGDVRTDPWDLGVSPHHFAEQLGVMQHRGRVIPLQHLLSESTADRLRSRRAQFAVTFDDGYVDNLATATPLLETFDSPATVFIAPGLLDRPSFWWDVLAAIVLEADINVAHLMSAARTADLLDGDVAATPGELDVEALHDAVHSKLVHKDLGAIDEALEQFVDALAIDIPIPAHRPLTTGELHALAVHPLVSIGVHTMTHPRLDCIPLANARLEILHSAQRLDELLGPAQRVLAYPYGAHSRAVQRLAADIGFDCAVTTESNWLRRGRQGLVTPRLHPRNVAGPEFEEWLRCWT